MRKNFSLSTLRAVLMVLLIAFGVGNAWAGGSSHSTHNGKVTFYNATGNGTVYLSTASGSNSGETAKSSPESKNGYSQITWSCGGSSSNDAKTLYPRGTVAAGYYYLGWTTANNSTSGYSTSSLSANASSDTDKKIYGYFETIKVTAAPSNVNINATDPTATYPDAAGVVVGFTTSKSNANGDFTTGGSGDSRWTISAWPTHASATSTTFNYKFVGNGSYGTNNRTFTKTVTLKGLNDATVKTCTLTAKYPNPKVVSGDESNEYTKIFTTFKATDETQSAVEKTAVFDVTYGDNGNNFSAAFSGITGGGTWKVSSIAVDQVNQKATVTYTFNGNKVVSPSHTATLTLTANDCKGWDDTDAEGSASASVAITADNSQEATDDVSVTTAAGVTTNYATWAAGLAAANASAGCTLTLLRNIDLTETYGLTATQGITQTFTLDLNGKTLSAAINGSVLNPKTAGKTLTIKDSKTGGKIENITPNYNGVTYGVNISAGDVVLESGTIHAENNAVFNHSSLASLGTRAVKLAANTKFTMSGGTLEAKGGREVYGIYQESSSDNNTADKSVVTISGGTIKAEAPACVYGIRSYGKVNMSGGTIDVTVNTEAVNSNTSYVAANFNDNTLHRYGYGIRMYATSSATLASNYFGTLTMTGGTINVTNLNKTMNGTTLYNEHIYGVKMEVSPTGAGAGKTAPDGTKVMKACAIGSIENATITLTHTGVLGYGVIATGCYNSVDNKTTPLQIKNSTINVTTFQTAYGVYADAYVNWSSSLANHTGNGGCTYGNIELTNTTINATTTGGTGAYCGWAACTSGTVADAKATTGSQSTGNATYCGEYAAAGKLVVNSGTYTANAATSSAYGFGSSDRAKTVRSIKGALISRDAATDPLGSLGGNAEAYPELYIHGGDISATTGTSTTAVAVKSGGNTVIDGGTFNAYSGAGTAYGLYVTAGKTTASGVTFPASATTKAYGVYVYGGITDWCLFPYAGEVELNNCNVTATARTTTDARAVWVEGLTKVYTQASFDAMKEANNSNYKTYGDYAQVGERAIIGKATINGGTYTATAETTYAYGIVTNGTKVSTNAEAVASSHLVVKNATVTAKTNTSTNAYGVQPGGGALIENCTISATSGTTTASGVRAVDKTTIIKNSTITAKGTDAVYGLEGYVEISGTHGYCWHGEFDLTEAGTTKVTAESTASSKPAYAIYLKAAKKNIASGTFMGDYAIAANATIHEGMYIAKINGGTSGYALALDAQQTQGSVVTQPEVLITGGKFNGATAEVGTAGIVGHVQLKGGCYVHNTNLAKYIPEGYEEFPLPSDRPEYTEGYRYAIEPVGNHGIDVCQIGSTKYKTLEEALQAATSGNTILMIANYTLPAGDWILKSGVKLLVPYSGQTATKETNLEYVEGTATPAQNLKLSFANGAHLVCNGTIEAGAKQTGQGSSELTGQVYGSYGHIYMAEGSSMTIESGATLYAWGYVTGKGEITIKNGGKSYEMFQFGWYKGGNTTSSIYSNRNSYKIFPMTDYSYQNIECPITYYPGASGYGKSAVKPSSYSSMERPLAMLVGTADNCMFKMTVAEASANTWVKKVYDPETDITNWIMNSGAAISGISMNVSVTVNSAEYYLPITSNFRITLNYGDLNINNDVIFLPGSQLIINKEATGILKSGKLLFFYDAEDWFTGLGHVSVTASAWSKAKTCGYYYYPATYSPTWGTSNPRKNVYARDKASIDKGVTPLPDAELFLHGKLELNGSLYTSGDGNKSSINRNANIHSTNEDAGKIIFNTNAPTASKALYKVCFAVGNSEANNSWSDMIYGGQTTAYPAHLQNGDGAYEQSSGTTSGSSWIYKNDQWVMVTTDGCFSVEQISGVKHYYAYPAAFVEVSSKDADAGHLYHDAATGTRNFVWDQNCYWWEVVTTPTAEGYYKSINADYNGKYNYYYYDNAAGCWKIKKITVTWNINGSTTDYSVGYGTKPEWYGGTPAKNSSSSDFYYIWDGWTASGSETLLANSELPEVTADITYTAHFYEKYYQYNITFKNDDGTVLESKNWNSGSTPSYEGTPEKEATASQTFEFNGTWSPAITTVSKAATYVAQYTAKTRQYDVTFLNYDMSVLGTTKVDYNATPTTATYKAAIAPSDYEPYKPDNSAYSFEFSGWKLNGASSNGFAQVKGDQTYIAQFTETTKKYRITFVDEDGETVLHWTQLEYDAMPSYDGPATSGFNKQDAEWTYVFTGWTPDEFTQVKGPQTYTATYNKTKRKYTITWLNDDNSQIDQTQVEYGEVPIHAAATKTATAEWTYSFAGWDNEPVAVMGDATYKAMFNKAKNSYKITWLNEDGSKIEDTTVEYGVVPAHANASKAATAEYAYSFNGWSPTPVDVTGIATYTATFSQTENKYSVSVTAYPNGSVSPASVSNIGCETASGDITATPNAGYNFVNWTLPEGVTAANGYDANSNPIRIHATATGKTITANIAARNDINYTVKHWQQNLNDDNYTEVTADQQTLQGTTATATTAAAKSYTGFTAQAFSQGTIAGNGSTIINIYYNRDTYTITWVDGDGNTIETDQNVKYGATPTYNGATPTKTQTNAFTYTFNGWDAELVAVEANATYTATFSEEPRPYTITWNNYDNAELTTTSSYWDETPAYPVHLGTPTYTDAQNHLYRFTGWDPAIHEVNSDNNIYTAQYVLVEHIEVTEDEPITMDATVTTTTVYVEGNLEITEDKTLTTDDLILEGTPTTSGEITGRGHLSATNAYFHFTQEGGFIAKTWYAVAVPWQVNAETGILINGEVKTLGRDFDLIYYDGYRRSQGATKAWNYVEDDADKMMVPGRAYMIYLVADAPAVRFKRAQGAELHNTTVDTKKYPSSNGDYADWNGIANPATYKAYLNVGATENNGQVYNAKTKKYELFDMSAKKLVVGQPIFVQPAEETTVVANRTEYTSSAAPRRQKTASAIIRHEVLFGVNDDQEFDRIIVRLDEDKEADEYTVGQDLAKMGVSSIVPQMWIDRYNSRLCINTIESVNNTATYPLSLFAPQAGEYTISCQLSAISGQTSDMLYLTYDGRVIWNLSYASYTASFEKGTDTHYGLKLVHYNAPTITTDVEQLSGDNDQMQIQKVILDDKVYILRGGEIYTITGQKMQ